MLTLSQIEQNLKDAMKAKDQVAVDVLRGLKTRFQNAQIAKTTTGLPERSEGSVKENDGLASDRQELLEEDILALVRSEIKKRKEAAEAFKNGNRLEMADKELKEAMVLEKYLPAQMSLEEISKLAEEVIAQGSFAAADFGKAMGALKARAGASADGASLAKILKEKLK